ncbi:hypothetical protein COB64_00620 [Candidatus Wolfebacteria bacterium]|nr:MAG: hypothetical protein COB64_00620 [Candidatus Wolfebacteria bacterium]
MFIFSPLFFQIAIILFSMVGFFISFYIHHKKKTDTPLVCPLGADCDTVVRSDYSKFIGIPIESLGMIYYGLIALGYAVVVLFPGFLPQAAVFALIVLTVLAFMFSLYLIAIQAFVFRYWCTWCIYSAFISTIILIATFFSSEYGFVSLLQDYRSIIIVVHALSAAIGLGAATVTDILFFKFLKDYKISEKEADIMSTVSQVIWFALGMLVISGLGIYVTNIEIFNASMKFLVKSFGVGVIIVNGIFLNLYIAPKLVQISFGKPHDHTERELNIFRKLAFALGSISLVSWYTVFILGAVLHSLTTPSNLFGIYFGLLALGLILSQIMERRFVKRKM